MLLLKNTYLVNPYNSFEGLKDILIKDEHIELIADNIDALDEWNVIDLEGKVTCPGFIDMHVHLREPGQEYKETIYDGCRAALAGGFTGVACMPNTKPVLDNDSIIEFVINRAKYFNLASVYPIGAITKGQEGKELAELLLMKEVGAVAFSDDGKTLANSGVMRRALDYVKSINGLIISHCEDKDLMGSGVIHEGEVSTKLGLAGIPSAVEEIIVDRDIRLAELTNSRIHIAHVSTAGSVEIIRRAKNKGVKVTAEVTPHHLLMNHEQIVNYDTNYKMNPPLRTKEDNEALQQAFQDGVIDCIVTDHAPHALEEKRVEFDYAPFGIVGLETAVPLIINHLYHKKKVNLLRIVEAFSTKPAQILGVEGGRIESGVKADLTIIDLELEKTVCPEDFYSKSVNTPFGGEKLKGWPVMTIKAGRILMEKGEING